MELSTQSISEFIASTTAHGFSRLHPAQSLPIKCMWLVFLMASIGGFSYHITLLISNYLTTPVSANISPGAIPFSTPDITICNVSPISSTNYYETVTKHYDVYMRLLSEAYSTQSVVESHGFGYNTDILMQVSRDMFDSSLLLNYLGHRREYFIVRCRYKGLDCNYRHFQNFWDSKFGNCFRFQPSADLLNATKDVTEFQLELVLFTDTNPVVTHPYSMEVYRMLTAGVTFEGEYDVSKSGGAILFYGDRDHYPRDYINLSPGVHSYVDFQMVEHRYVSRNAKACLEAGGIVYYEDSDRTRLQFRKNRIDCQYRKLLEKIISDCQCFSTRIAPSYVNLTETFKEMRCSHLVASTATADFLKRRNCERDAILKKSSYFNQMTDCLPNCAERIYTPIISMTTWPLNSLAVSCKNSIMNQTISNLLAHNVTPPDTFYYFLRNITTPPEVQRDFSTNFAQVSLGEYTDFSTLMQEVPSYLIFDLFSSIGGILGLYLGMSLLTVCELFELLFVLAAEFRAAAHGHKTRRQWRRHEHNGSNSSEAGSSVISVSPQITIVKSLDLGDKSSVIESGERKQQQESENKASFPPGRPVRVTPTTTATAGTKRTTEANKPTKIAASARRIDRVW